MTNKERIIWNLNNINEIHGLDLRLSGSGSPVWYSIESGNGSKTISHRMPAVQLLSTVYAIVEVLSEINTKKKEKASNEKIKVYKVSDKSIGRDSAIKISL